MYSQAGTDEWALAHLEHAAYLAFIRADANQIRQELDRVAWWYRTNYNNDYTFERLQNGMSDVAAAFVHRNTIDMIEALNRIPGRWNQDFAESVTHENLAERARARFFEAKALWTKANDLLSIHPLLTRKYQIRWAQKHYNNEQMADLAVTFGEYEDNNGNYRWQEHMDEDLVDEMTENDVDVEHRLLLQRRQASKTQAYAKHVLGRDL